MLILALSRYWTTIQGTKGGVSLRMDTEKP